MLLALASALAPWPGRAESAGNAADAALAGHPALPRIVTLAPHITELVFAAGAGGYIVGTVSSSDHPAEARAIPRVGDGLRINTETLLTHRPSIVLAWAPPAVIQVLSSADIDIRYSQPRSLDDIPEEIQRFGQLFGTAGTAAPRAESLRQRIAALRERYAGRPPVSVFLDLGETPLYTLGSEPLFNSVMAACGGVNLYAHTGIQAPMVSPEGVMARQPDVILIAAPPQAEGRHTPWKALRLAAARYYVNPDALLRPGPRLVDAAEQVCEHLEAARRH